MGHNEVAGDAQPQAHALREAPVAAAAIEWLKDPLLLGRGDADAGVGDSNHHAVVHHRCLDRYRTLGCVLDGVAQQVAQRLGHAVGVNLEHRKRGGNLGTPMQALVVGHLAPGRY